MVLPMESASDAYEWKYIAHKSNQYLQDFQKQLDAIGMQGFVFSGSTQLSDTVVLLHFRRALPQTGKVRTVAVGKPVHDA